MLSVFVCMTNDENYGYNCHIQLITKISCYVIHQFVLPYENDFVQSHLKIEGTF